MIKMNPFQPHRVRNPTQNQHQYQQNPFPPKRRSACDQCHQAKVKCSGEPTCCVRCLERDFECRYSDASKAGKPKGSRNRKTLGRLHQLREREREARTREPRGGDVAGRVEMQMENDCWPWHHDSDVDRNADGQDLDTIWQQGNWTGVSDTEIIDNVGWNQGLDFTLGNAGSEDLCSSILSSSPRKDSSYATSNASFQDLLSEAQPKPFSLKEKPKQTARPRRDTFTSIGSLDLSSFRFDREASNAMVSQPDNTNSKEITETTTQSPQVNTSPCNCFETITKCLNNLYTSKNPTTPHQHSQVQHALTSCRVFFACVHCPADGFSLLLVLSIIRIVLRSLEDLIIPSSSMANGPITMTTPNPTPQSTSPSISPADASENKETPEDFMHQALFQSSEILESLTLVLGESAGRKCGGTKARKSGMLEPTESDLAYVRLTVSRQEGVLELLRRRVWRMEVG